MRGVKTYFRSTCLSFLLNMFSCFRSVNVIHLVSCTQSQTHSVQLISYIYKDKHYFYSEIQFYFTFFHAHTTSLPPSQLTGCPENLTLNWHGRKKITMCSKNILNHFTYVLTAYHIPDFRFEVYLILLQKEPFQEHSMQ